MIDQYTKVGDDYGMCTETLTISPSLGDFPWIRIEGRKITVESSDLTLSGKSYTFIVTSTINDDLTTSDSSVSFTVSFSELAEVDPKYIISTN